MQHSVLIGNGINIQFSDNKEEYKNKSIILRALSNMKSGKYSEIFENIIEPDELYETMIQMVGFYNNYLKKGFNFQNAVNTDDEFSSFMNSIILYKNKDLQPEDIMMEDYFLLFNLFNNYWKNKHPNDEIIENRLFFTALLQMFTDAIYNDGKIETIYKNMGNFKKTLNNFDNIFTINYDNNIDMISDKPVYHLHGNFNTIQDRFNPSTVLGYINEHSEHPVNYIKDMKHVYSNAIMGFSGKIKIDDINMFNNSSIALNTLVTRLNNPNDLEIHTEYNRLKNSNKQIDKDALLMIDTKLEHPQLTYTEYPLSEFKNISGWLSIIGMSPNNDNHLIDIINKNSKLKKVIYFYKENKERDWMQKHIVKERHLLCKKVEDYWESLGC